MWKGSYYQIESNVVEKELKAGIVGTRIERDYKGDQIKSNVVEKELKAGTTMTSNIHRP